ncbi:MAG: AbrB/MazE/SpoVT family DNA-binding domain-containing protein [Candidatus Diapherotrites archaeon]
MDSVELTKMSSRGQVVIPQNIREKMGLKEGEAFAAVASGNTLMLRRIKTPSKEDILKELERLAVKGEARAKKLGLKEKDVDRIIHEARGTK